jgi:SAM-dependent methyltransferase
MADADSSRHDLLAAYETAPYESYAHPQSAPGHLAALAWVFGLDAPEVPAARVLELGCASGGNLIPFAAAHPRAQAVGIDLSPMQIEQGRSQIRELGLDNVELIAADIAQLDRDALGQFDYVIAHGVYSWVPDDIQEAILAACRGLLAPTGVAYLSYNVYPGWKAKEIVRDAMLLGVPDGAGPKERVRRARDMVDFLQEVAQPDTVLARALADYQEMAAQTGDYYLLHEELEPFNSPCYFRDIAARAHAHGLKYLAEARLEFMFVENYGPIVSDRLSNGYGGDRILLEQHLDFVINRRFRETLFVHSERAPQIGYRLQRSRFERLHFASWTPPLAGETTLDSEEQAFGYDALSFVVADGAVKAAVDALNARWPWTLSRADLLASVRARLAEAGVDEQPDLDGRIDSLLELLIVRGEARIRLEAVSPAAAGSPIRLAPEVRRMAGLAGEDEESFVFNPWHEILALSSVDRYLVPLLDGHTDRQALLGELIDLFHDNVIRIEHDDEQVLDEEAAAQLLGEYVDTLPERLADLKLLDLDVYPPLQ